MTVQLSEECVEALLRLAYLNRQGGIRSQALTWADHNLCFLKACHVPRSLKVETDRMSRGDPLEEEWSITKSHVQAKPIMN